MYQVEPKGNLPLDLSTEDGCMELEEMLLR